MGIIAYVFRHKTIGEINSLNVRFCLENLMSAQKYDKKAVLSILGIVFVQSKTTDFASFDRQVTIIIEKCANFAP